MSAPALVVEADDGASAVAGTFLVESVVGLGDALESGSWLDVGLAGATVALDAAALAVDPLGQLLAMGLGWLIEHVEPLTSWLEELTGDAGAVETFAATWDTVGRRLDTAGQDYAQAVRTDLETMSGEALAAYTAHAQRVVAELTAVGGSATAMASALRLCATVVQVVHDVVRDAIAQVVGSAISWAAELALTAGLATPVVAAQVSTKVASLATRVGSKVAALLTSVRALRGLAEELADALRGVMTRGGSGGAVVVVRTSGARYYRPGELPISRMASGRPADDLAADAWATEIYSQLASAPSLADEIAGGLPGWQAFEVAEALDHVLRAEHWLGGGQYGPLRRGRFDADPFMAEALLRLRAGSGTARDEALLRHEVAEARYERAHPEASYQESHAFANTVADWQQMIMDGSA